MNEYEGNDMNIYFDEDIISFEPLGYFSNWIRQKWFWVQG